MARTAEKVRDLVDEDPAFAGALQVLLDHEGEVIEWRDVNDDLTSGQWGRLIEKNVLVDAGDGFRLADADAVREELDGEATVTTTTTSSDEDDEDSGWSKWDKLAAVGSIGLFAGYSMNSVRAVIGGIMDLLLGPIDAVLPFYAVIMVLATVTGLYSTILQSNLMNMEKMGEYQERMKEIREREKAARERGDDEALEKIREEQMSAMGDQAGMFKEQFRPMVWIMLFTIPVFLWMYWKLLEGHVAEPEMHVVFPLAGETNLNDGIFVMPAWIVWYFLCSMSFTQVIRKSLNIQTTPT
jgi:uncharacterized membrane protein (DUF106 family)